MPELPEVETARRGIAPHVCQRIIHKVIIRQPQLRWTIPKDLPQKLKNQTIQTVKRRGKYLLLETDRGTAIIHLGMSGYLRVLSNHQPIDKHDHVDIIFTDDTCLRLTDPRRFGALLWSENPEQHPLLLKLGPEPLSTEFNGDYLFQHTRGKKQVIKQAIMDSHTVVGVGNIYANEALFCAGINPRRPAGKISRERCHKLATCIKKILTAAINKGGTTLKDFKNSEGKPGYFRQSLKVYGRAGEPCKNCGKLLQQIRLGQRSTVFCSRCQRY